MIMGRMEQMEYYCESERCKPFQRKQDRADQRYKAHSGEIWTLVITRAGRRTLVVYCICIYLLPYTSCAVTSNCYAIAVIWVATVAVPPVDVPVHACVGTHGFHE